MTTSLRLASALSGLALVAAGLTPAAAADAPVVARRAHVSQLRVTDPLHDLWAPVEANGPYGPAPERVDGDLTSLRVGHRDRRLVLRYAATTLPRLATDRYDLMIAGSGVRTPDGHYYVTYYGDSSRTGVMVGRANHEPTRCRGVRSGVDWSAATVRVSVPRRCLGDPRWVQVASTLAYAWPGGGDSDFYADGIPGSGDPTQGRQQWSARVWHPGE